MAYPVQPDPTSVFGRRVLAAIIDAALIFVPVIMLVTAQFEYLEAADLPGTGEEFCEARSDSVDGFCLDFTDVDDRVYFSDGVPGTGSALLWGATFCLHVILQGFTGWTLGKLATGIRTVGEDGLVPGFVKAMLRWLLWIVDGFPWVVPLVGPIVGLTTVGHRRVGDMVAKTFVVRASAAGSPIVVPGLTTSPAAGPVGGWGPPPTTEGGAATGWGQAVDPSSAGWAAPPTATPTPTPTPAPSATTPQWDEARGTYIQWDPAQSAWMQWNEALRTWSRIPGQ